MINTHRSTARTPFVVLLALMITLTLGACETDQTEPGVGEEDTLGAQAPPIEQDTSQMGAAGAQVDEIEGDPSEYMGQTVRVEGAVANVWSQRAFTLEGDWLGGNLLVVVPQDVDIAGYEFSQGDNIQITGDVREYIQAEIEQEFGLDAGAQIEYEEQEPMVVAQSITPGVKSPQAE